MKNIFLLLFVCVMFLGCTEVIETPVLSDTEEIERYLLDDDLGKIFFATDNLVSEQPYTYPFDTTGYYIDLLDSIDRTVIAFYPLKTYGVGYPDPIQLFGSPFGSSQDAEVEVRDKVYVRTVRVEGVDTFVVLTNVLREYTRFGYFMKLGDDGQKFSGWILRAFSGGSPGIPTRANMYHENNEWFPGDTFTYQHYTSEILYDSLGHDALIKLYTTIHGYLLINGDSTIYTLVERIPKGEQIRAEIQSSAYGVFQNMVYNTADTIYSKNFTLNEDSKYDVIIPTANVNINTWDFIYFQEFVRDVNDTTTTPNFRSLKRRNWIIPFKVE